MGLGLFFLLSYPMVADTQNLTRLLSQSRGALPLSNTDIGKQWLEAICGLFSFLVLNNGTFRNYINCKLVSHKIDVFQPFFSSILRVILTKS